MKLNLIVKLSLVLSSPTIRLAQNSPFSVWGAGLDGSVYQQSAIYSQLSTGLLLEAPLDAQMEKLPIQFGWRGGGLIPLKIMPSGNIGIGTTTPQAKLDVNGDIIGSDLVSGGSNSWIFHTPDDGRKTLHISPKGAPWAWEKALVINGENGNVSLSGGLNANGAIVGSDLVSGGSNSWIFHTPDDGRKTLHIAPKGAPWAWEKALVINGENGNALVQGKFEAKEIKVTTSPTADFVFEQNYHLPALAEVDDFIKTHKHLPEIASAGEMEKGGVNVGEFQIKLLQKIEELTLYSIEQHAKLAKLTLH